MVYNDILVEYFQETTMSYLKGEPYDDISIPRHKELVFSPEP